MATKKSSGGGQSSSRSSAKGKSSKPVYARAGQQPSKQAGPLLDDQTRRDIAAVVLIVVAVVLMACAVMSPTGMVTGALAMVLRFCLGLGVYVLPVLLVILAATFLVRFERQRVPTRVAIGFALLFLAFLTIAALFTPDAEANPNTLFVQQRLVVHGGYVGAGIAWACLELLGLTVSMIVMAGLIIVALLIIGLSFSSIIERLRSKSLDEEDGDPFDHLPRQPSFARMLRIVAPRLKTDPVLTLKRLVSFLKQNHSQRRCLIRRKKPLTIQRKSLQVVDIGLVRYHLHLRRWCSGMLKRALLPVLWVDGLIRTT